MAALARRAVGLGACAAGLLSATVASPTHACSCVPTAGTPTEVLVAKSVRRQDAVFAGVVSMIADVPADDAAWRAQGGRHDSRPLLVMLRVKKVWKGDVGDRVAVHTHRQSAMCGYSFREEGEYLVYASRRKGRLWVSLCSRTRLLAAVGDEQELLDALTANGSRVPPPSAGVWLPPRR